MYLYFYLLILKQDKYEDALSYFNEGLKLASLEKDIYIFNLKIGKCYECMV